MSVPKGKRNESKKEFERLLFQVADDVDNFVEHNFFAEDGIISKNNDFIRLRKYSVEKLSDELLYNIRIASSIYPQNKMEFEERRLYMDKAIGTCFAILTQYQRILRRLRISDEKYASSILVLSHMINSLKAWRKSDNKLKDKFK